MKRDVPSLEMDTITHGQNKRWDARDYFVTDGNIHNLLRYHSYRQNCYQLAICTSGTIHVRMDGKDFFYEKDTFAALVPSTVIEVMEVSDDYQCLFLYFRDSFLTETLNTIYFLERFLLFNRRGTFFLRFNSNEAECIRVHFDNIRKKMEDVHHSFRRDIIRSLIIILIYEIESILRANEDNAQAEVKPGKDKVIADFQNLLKRFFYKEHKVSFYALSLQMTTNQLSTILKEATGMTTKEHIDHIILSQAKVFLNSGKYNVSEVALLLNYNNMEEFSRFFKKKTGINPLRFSKED